MRRIQSIDLTRLPRFATGISSGDTAPAVEFSAREVSPPALLRQQIVQAHSIFLLHHGTNLDTLFQQRGRSGFCTILDQFWLTFARTWDILLHGNPAVEAFGGIKLAAGGELGIGVGEERWGSGEREVLEGFVQRTEGLVDLVVSRLGDGDSRTGGDTPRRSNKPPDIRPLSKNAVVFIGAGTIKRTSLRVLNKWMEWIYIHGPYAYGIQDHSKPMSTRRQQSRQKERRNQELISERSQAVTVSAAPNSQNKSPDKEDVDNKTRSTDTTTAPRLDAHKEDPTSRPLPGQEASSSGSMGLMKYITLGYGSSWGPKSSGVQKNPSRSKAQTGTVIRRDQISKLSITRTELQRRSLGFFSVGLQSNLDRDDEMEELHDERTKARSGTTSEPECESRPCHRSQITSRTVYINLSKSDVHVDTEDDPASLRVVVYQVRPSPPLFFHPLDLQS